MSDYALFYIQYLCFMFPVRSAQSLTMMNEQVAGGMDEPVVFSEELALDTPELRGIFSNSEIKLCHIKCHNCYTIIVTQIVSSYLFIWCAMTSRKSSSSSCLCSRAFYKCELN